MDTRSRQAVLVLGGIIVLAAGSIWAIGWFGDAGGRAERRAVREAVLGALKAPATAQFVGEVDYEFPPGGLEVSGQVDAQNAYGAMVRSRWTVALHHERGEVVVDSVRVE